MTYQKRLKEWLDQIYEPVEGEISCRELMDRLPAYVDAIVNEHHPNGEYVAFQQHMAKCPECSELYEELLNLARLEEDGRLPEIEELLANFAAPGTAESEEIVAVPTV
ncbi:MAG: hypothetical protein WAM60_11680 [Candidatus Promineifilaceae bacterium]